MLFSKAKALYYVIWSNKCSGDLYGIRGMPRASALGTIGADAPIYPRHEGVLRHCHSEHSEESHIAQCKLRDRRISRLFASLRVTIGDSE